MTNLTLSIRNSSEILGINERNYRYLRLNKGLKSLADNKLLTKKLLKSNDIPTPEVYGVIKNRRDLENFDFDSLPNSFVLKPSRGVKGAGITIYYNRLKDGRWITASREKHEISDLKTQVQNILDGQYSLGIRMRSSAAIFEERVKMHPSFKHYSYRGIPDIRVIVYRKVPVMAMLRLPTEESGGKANINRGALGVGIDMARGVTTDAIKNNRLIESVPNKRLALSGIKVPYWTKILRIAHQCQVVSGIGYLGVDIIIDKEKGPMVVELNARPGLGIQAANQDGLKDRLEKVRKVKSVTESKAVRLTKDLFGGEIDEELENITGRELIGLTEKICFMGKNMKEICVACKIDTGADSSSIDKRLAVKLGYEDVVNYYEKIIHASVADKQKEERRAYKNLLYKHKEVVKVTHIKTAAGLDYRVKIELPAKINDKEFLLRASISNRSKLNYPVLLGKNDLKGFLIDTTKRGSNAEKK
ncbi:MAG: sugar-transfer associated ATP-grasp domain-containing protein [Patescibacteria group bacterium]|nr:sugar-transfer associated ATP-grasp domain-containing protein [Patescibacteria group bacterium]